MTWMAKRLLDRLLKVWGSSNEGTWTGLRGGRLRMPKPPKNDSYDKNQHCCEEADKSQVIVERMHGLTLAPSAFLLSRGPLATAHLLVTCPQLLYHE